MRIFMVGLIVLASAGAIFIIPGVMAAQRQSNANTFGYGARLDLAGQQLKTSMTVAAGLGLDWVAIDFDWASLMPRPDQHPDLSMLNFLFDAARKDNLRVMLSVRHAPSWAATQNGPDPQVTASLAISLARLYGNTLGAIELYPGANTQQSWGVSPNPASYAELLRIVDATLKTEQLSTILVASLAFAHDQGDMGDALFLDGLYQAGASEWMPVVGIEYPGLSGVPTADPGAGAEHVLRHYETLRQVMLQYNHSRGRIWISSFSWPSEPASASPEGQSQWLQQAFQLLRGQLYIGIAFFRQLNPPDSGVVPAGGFFSSLILPDGSLHPACVGLAQLTSINKSIHTVNFQGPVTKRSPNKMNLKP